jgi:hypothetical protein
MRPLALAAIQAGLIDDDTLAQFQRWGFVPRTLDKRVQEDPDLIVERIQFALEAEEQVRMQSTDLDLLKFYLDPKNQIQGQMVIATEDAKATKAVTFAKRERSAVVQYIIPWISESVVDIVTNGKTYLRYVLENRHVKVYFDHVEELYFGDVKAFMVGTGMESW